ncbi:putative sodium-coupled monocarboxylate transporter 2 [Apostichopus japonicus]|uniref:Putative sodium-coupled monocarboxylate transporter 2 n=1 Tax=Stichopus japonicus TaxID=307972 RepID=A0A2G8KR09_STIJA|nr:putative sodium-coupled monocarboxylate transporter 2 [Apostichopus japonicus]
MGISIYGPALALNAVSGLSLPGSIIVSGFVCTFYSTIGGIKAVMWADVFQSMIMLCGFLVTAIACCIQVGGLDEVFHINARDGRDTVFDFRIDPRSQAAAGIGTSLMGLVELIAVITGVCMYAFYAGCDPVSSGKVSRADQLMVYIVVDLFENTPGVAGFIISAVFSSALSTTSSGINAIAAVVGYDVIKTQFPGIQG